MKILLVIDDYLNNNNGMSISTQRFAEEFKKMGHQVRILATGHVDYSLKEMKIPIFANLIAKQGFHFAKPDKKIVTAAVQWSDIVHLDTPFPIGWQAQKIAHKYGKAVTGTFHIYPENMTASVPVLDKKWINEFIMRFFKNVSYKYASYIQAPTAHVKKIMKQYRFPQNISVISNGISEEFLNNKHNYDPVLPFTILSIGRYSYEKDQITLIKALQHSKYKNQIQLILAGQGPLKDKYQKLASTLPNKPIMKYFSPKELRKIEQTSQLVVHCANVEIEGMSCMEAFASGCVPIIAKSRLSSTSSYALTPNNRFEAGNEKELAQKIDYWFEHRNELNSMSKKYVQYAKNLSVNSSAKQVINMMKKATSLQTK